jgi:hypothetical protein
MNFGHDRMKAALAPIDEAFRASEAKWGVGRLERIVSTNTIASYRRGWVAYRAAIEAGDAATVETLAPKMIAALAFMDREATAAGHSSISISEWETILSTGTVLAIVRTGAEAHALAKDTRSRLVYTLEEIGRIVEHYEMTNAIKLAFPGATVTKAPNDGEKVVSGVQMSEGEVADWATSEPLDELLHA